MTLSSNNVESKYKLVPITDKETYQKSCALLEELDESVLEETDDLEEKLAYLDALAILIEAYEDKHFKFNQFKLTPLQAIEQAMEQLNMSKKDLANLIGSNRVSEIFSGKRELSLAQIRIIHQKLNIPTDILIGI
jgi:HTH-type transcriptional regulator / antitoxin HigA